MGQFVSLSAASVKAGLTAISPADTFKIKYLGGFKGSLYLFSALNGS